MSSVTNDNILDAKTEGKLGSKSLRAQLQAALIDIGLRFGSEAYPDTNWEDWVDTRLSNIPSIGPEMQPGSQAALVNLPKWKVDHAFGDFLESFPQLVIPRRASSQQQGGRKRTALEAELEAEREENRKFRQEMSEKMQATEETVQETARELNHRVDGIQVDTAGLRTGITGIRTEMHQLGNVVADNTGRIVQSETDISQHKESLRLLGQ